MRLATVPDASPLRVYLAEQDQRSSEEEAGRVKR
jgi:hypothetical protein